MKLLIRQFIYSLLKASTGLIETALRAGIKPARAPETINTESAFKATDRSTEGFENILFPPDGRVDETASRSPIPATNPKYPAKVVRKTDSRIS